jgi:hypothetical protein
VTLARVTVRKFVDGAWIEKDFSVSKGDRIGRPGSVSRGGRAIAVDFTTGFEVLAIDPVKGVRTEKAVRSKFDPKTAQKIGEEETTVSREVQTWKMTYRDDTGRVCETVVEEGGRQAPRALPPGPEMRNP